MLNRIISKVNRMLHKKTSGYNITDKALLNAYEGNDTFPRLISFPRTGSHWLRMMMELYFEKPSLVYVFYHKNPVVFTCIHKHDVKLDLAYSENIIYLFRNPVDVVYSNLKFDDKGLGDENYIKLKTIQYGKHIKKWVIDENFAAHKTLITYENLKKNTAKEFQKVCKHLDEEFDLVRFNNILSQIDKQKIRKNTMYNPKILNNSKGYESKRKEFKTRFKEQIMDWFYSVDPKLRTIY